MSDRASINARPCDLKQAGFDHVISLAVTFSVIALRRDFPANSIAGLIAYTKANPGKLNSNWLIGSIFRAARGAGTDNRQSQPGH